MGWPCQSRVLPPLLLSLCPRRGRCSSGRLDHVWHALSVPALPTATPLPPPASAFPPSSEGEPGTRWAASSLLPAACTGLRAGQQQAGSPACPGWSRGQGPLPRHLQHPLHVPGARWQEAVPPRPRGQHIWLCQPRGPLPSFGEQWPCLSPSLCLGWFGGTGQLPSCPGACTDFRDGAGPEGEADGGGNHCGPGGPPLEPISHLHCSVCLFGACWLGGTELLKPQREGLQVATIPLPSRPGA